MPFCNFTLTAQKPRKPSPILNTIGYQIKKRRLELKLLQKEVAGRLEVDECTITNWEKDRTRPMLHLLPKIIEFLGYNPNPTNSEAKTLGEKVLQYRKSCGISQKELAKRIGIDPTTLSRLERDQGKCFSAVQKKLVYFLKSLKVGLRK